MQWRRTEYWKTEGAEFSVTEIMDGAERFGEKRVGAVVDAFVRYGFKEDDLEGYELFGEFCNTVFELARNLYLREPGVDAIWMNVMANYFYKDDFDRYVIRNPMLGNGLGLDQWIEYFNQSVENEKSLLES